MMRPYLIHHYFEQAAARYPHKVAVRFQDRQHSYQELLAASNRIALSLRRKGVQRGDRVCALISKSPAAVAAMLGILKSDAIYVPLDGDSLSLRIKIIIRDCDPFAVICDHTSIAFLEQYRQEVGNAFHIMELHNDDCLIDGPDEPTPPDRVDQKKDYRCIDTDIAYLIYTSGSSGTPKGVMISHLNLCNYIEWALDYFNIQADHKILNTAPLHFDMAIFDLFTALGSGGTLTLVSKKTQLFPSKLIDVITADKITIWKAAASLLAYFVKTNALRPGILPDLEKVIFSGEPLHPKYLAEWMRVLPEKRFYNAYGPTEATGISTCYEIKDGAFGPLETVPIGSACNNTEVFAVTESGDFAGPGVSGELMIRGSGVSCGYWNNPEKTAQSFINIKVPSGMVDRVYATGDLVRHLPEGGAYAFVGRKDFQIKHFGYRIEPGEIESVLCMQPEVNDAAVIAVGGVEQNAPEIIAFVETNELASGAKLANTLRRNLSTFMVPHKLISLKVLPRTENGKVDRQKLKAEYLKSSPGSPGSGSRLSA